MSSPVKQITVIDPQPGQEPDALMITPDALVAMLQGNKKIAIKGFERREQAPLPFWMPATILRQYNQETSGTVAASKTIFSLTYKFAVAALVFCTAALGYWAGTLNKTTIDGGSRWITIKANNDSLLIDSNGQHLVVPIGGMLPNGEILKSTDTLKQVYSTDSQIVTIR